MLRSCKIQRFKPTSFYQNGLRILLLFKVIADMADMIHKGTGALISHEFSALYKKEWHKASDSLRPTKSDEEIIYVLLRIVRVSDFILCLTIL